MDLQWKSKKIIIVNKYKAILPPVALSMEYMQFHITTKKFENNEHIYSFGFPSSRT